MKIALSATLPKEPVDRFEIRRWHVDVQTARVVSLHQFIYCVNTPWRAIFPQDAQDDLPDGAPFVNQWQVIENGHFTGRLEGWRLDLEPPFVARLFETEQEAWSEAERLLTIEQIRLEARLAEIKASVRAVKRKRSDHGL